MIVIFCCACIFWRVVFTFVKKCFGVNIYLYVNSLRFSVFFNRLCVYVIAF